MLIADGTLGLDVVGGSQLANNVVNTNHMVSGAITNAAQNTGSGGATSNTWTSAASVTMTVGGRCTIAMITIQSALNTGFDIDVAIYVDGTAVWQTTCPSGNTIATSYSVSLSAGSHTFALYTHTTTSGHNIGFSSPTITILDGQA